jgi:hypothetical protein
MSCVLDQVQCEQCGNPEADYQFSSYREVTTCNRCGYWERWDPQYDGRECCGWKHEICDGAGVLGYQLSGQPAFTSRCLKTKAQVLRAERWLRKRLADRSVDRQTAYLTRWDKQGKRVELIIGSLQQL